MIKDMTEFTLYQYGDEGYNDSGFGCVYRNVQTMLSCLSLKNPTVTVPSIREMISEIKGPGFEKLPLVQRWIEPADACNYIQQKFGIIGHNYMSIGHHGRIPGIMTTDKKIYEYSTYGSLDMLSIISAHFQKSDIPVLIDDGTMSYLIIGYNENMLHISDPHTRERKVYFWPEERFGHSGWMIYIIPVYQDLLR